VNGAVGEYAADSGVTVTPGDCGENDEGYYVDGTVNAKYFNEDGELVAVTVVGNDTFQQVGSAAGDPSTPGDYGHSNANPGSFLSLVFSPSVPLYVPNDVPLSDNARVVLGKVSSTTHSLGNPCTVGKFYGQSFLVAVSFGASATGAGGAAIFPAIKGTATALNASGVVAKLLPYVVVTSAAAKFSGLYDRASDKVQKACDALE
jgi:hypothetical protein